MWKSQKKIILSINLVVGLTNMRTMNVRGKIVIGKLSFSLIVE